MSAGDGDMLFGTLVLAAFLVFVFAFGLAINHWKNRRFARAWAPLVPIVGGRVVDDAGGSATSWLVGTFEGRRVAASTSPGRNRYSGVDAGAGHRYNHFDAALCDEPGAAGWTLEERAGALGLGRTEWQVRTAEPGLADRLRSAGVIELAVEVGAERVEYSPQERTLRVSFDLGPRSVPAPGPFRLVLGALLRLAAAQSACNAPPSA
jgi:hypothetical protein